MKKILMLALFVSATAKAYSQPSSVQSDDTTIFYNKAGHKIAQGQIVDKKREGLWKVFYNDNIIFEVTYKNNFKEGPATFLDSNSQVLRAKGNCHNDLKSGIWKYYARNGKLTSIENNYNGYIEDTAFFYDSLSGNKISEGKFFNSKREGLWQYYVPATGKLLETETYANGILQGHAAYYDDVTGEKYAEGEHVNNKRKGQWTFYFHSNGKLKSTETYEGMVLNGPAKYYDSVTLNLTSEGDYLNDVKVGEWSEYDPYTKVRTYKGIYTNKGKVDGIVEVYDSSSGNLLVTGNVSKNVKEGELITYYPGTNKIMYKETFHKDLLDGPAAAYDSAGRVMYKGTYKKDLKTGEWMYYYNGTEQLECIINFEEGLISGNAKYFDSATGFITEEGKRLNGKAIGERKYYYAGTQKLKETVNWKDDMANGVATFYYITGQIEVQGMYSADRKDGIWQAYDTTGRLRKEEHYKKGLIDGTSTEYDANGMVTATANFKQQHRDGVTNIYYDGTDKLWIEANFKNDSLEGTTICYYPSGKIKRKETIQNGVRINAQCFSESGAELKYSPMSTHASFSGDVMTYIGKNLHYPESSKIMGIEGKVLIGFIVNQNGLVVDATVLAGIDELCDKEALRLVSQMPPWIPAQIDGRSYDEYKTLPIVFWKH